MSCMHNGPDKMAMRSVFRQFLHNLELSLISLVLNLQYFFFCEKIYL